MTRLLDGTEIVTYIGQCCREWVLATGFPGRCGIKRPDDGVL